MIFWCGATLVAKDIYSLEETLAVFTLLLFSLAGASTIVSFGIFPFSSFIVSSILISLKFHRSVIVKTQQGVSSDYIIYLEVLMKAMAPGA